MSFLSDILLFNSTSRRYKRDRELKAAILADSELAKVSKKMGVKSIIFSAITILILAAAAVGIYLLFNAGEDMLFIAIIVSLLILAVVVIITCELYVRGLRFLIWQFKLNKHPIRWLALILNIIPSLLFALSVGFIIYVFLAQ